MQTQTPESRPVPESRFRLIWKRISRHPVLKLSSVLLAIIFWLVVIASDPSIERQKEILASASVTGADTLRTRGYVVTDDLTSEAINVEITAKVTQGNYNRATASSFSPGSIFRRLRARGGRRFSSPLATARTARSFPSTRNPCL